MDTQNFLEVSPADCQYNHLNRNKVKCSRLDGIILIVMDN